VDVGLSVFAVIVSQYVPMPRGGVLMGEHGAGIKKCDLMPTMSNDTDLAQQIWISRALDAIPSHIKISANFFMPPH